MVLNISHFEPGAVLSILLTSSNVPTCVRALQTWVECRASLGSTSEAP